jgi:hypothetical protein
MQSTLRPLSTLPEPAPEALAASRALAREIEGAIVAAGGAIDFSRYMELALYAPGLGYYTGGARKFGAQVVDEQGLAALIRGEGPVAEPSAIG